MEYSNTREMRGMEMARAISDKPDVAIQRLNKLTYKVKSQSDASKFYTVIKQYSKTYGDNMRYGKWTCDCPDHTFRNVICKHIHAVLFSKLLRKKVYQDNLIQTPINQNIIDSNKVGKIVCQRCGSENHKKWGVRHNKKAGDIQTYLCQDCSYRFTFNPAFENAKASARTISNAIDLYFKGVSLRQIAEHLQSQGTEINYSSICRWIRKFNQTVQPYVDSFVPAQVGGIYHVDEMLLHVRKEDNDMNMTLENKENHTNRKFDNHYSWLWNLMDDTTRFWVSSMVSQRRETADARAVFQDQKEKTGTPKAIIHDGLASYNDAFQKEYYTMKNPRVKNIRSISVRNEGLNSRVERLNGTMRDREKVMRGMHSRESAQKIIEAMRIHYNYCREHSQLGKTPAEQAGIHLPLEPNRVESLMRLASNYGLKKDVER